MGAMDPREPPTLQRLRQMAPELLALTAAHGGRDLRVFGSVIRGAAGLQSDVDLLVDFPSSPSFEQYMDLKLALEDLLSARVDLVTRGGLRPELRQRIEQEAIPLA
jgi:predicted nucleotidyltransferase